MSDFHGPAASRALRERLEGQNLEKLNEQEEAVLKQKMAAVDKLFNDQLKAKYKLEVQFHEMRSTWKPFAGVMSFFLNGNRLHGGGDSKVYLCSDTTCYGVVDPSQHSVVDLNEDPEQIKPVKVVCPKCNRIQLANDLWGERLLRLTPQGWARALLNNFRYLESNADVSLIFHHKEIQSLTRLDLEKKASGKVMAEARRWREKAIYPLRNIVKDTVSGADLGDRFLAFVRET